MVFELVLPRSTPPGNYTVTVRGCSNWEWGNLHPELEFYDDAIFHVESNLTARSLPFYRPDLLGAVNVTLGFSGDDVYEDDPSEQVLSSIGNPQRPGNYTLAIQNDANVPDTISVTGPATGPFWTVNYFLDGSNVTDQVTSGGLPLTLDPGELSTLIVTVRPSTYQHGLSGEVVVLAMSLGNISKADAYKLTTTVVDEAPPSITVIEPENGTSFTHGSWIAFSVSLQDDTGLKNATLILMNANRGEILREEKELSGRNTTVRWEISPLAAGEYIWSIEACDNVYDYGGVSNCVQGPLFYFEVAAPPVKEGLVVLRGDLRLEPSRLAPGDALVAHLTLANEGRGSAEGIKVALELPPGMTPTSNCSAAGRTLQTDYAADELLVSVGRIGPKELIAISCPLKVDPQTPEGMFTLYASYRGIYMDYAILEVVGAPSPPSTPSPTPAASATIRVETAATPSEALPGDSIQITVSVSNVGSAASDSIILEITLPPGLNYVNGSFMVAGVKARPEHLLSGLRWQIGRLQAGRSVSVSFYVRAEEGHYGYRDIRACANAGCSSTTVRILSPPEASVLMSAEAEAVSEGFVDFKVTIEISGGDAGPADLEVLLPPGVSYVSGSALIDRRSVEPTIEGSRLVWHGLQLEEGLLEIRLKLNVEQANPGDLAVVARLAELGVSAQETIRVRESLSGPSPATTESPESISERGTSKWYLTLPAMLISVLLLLLVSPRRR